MYWVDLPMHLIQSIRVCHALIEAGVELSVNKNDVEKFEHLKSYFDIDFHTDREDAKKVDNISLSHEEPKVEIGGLQVPLLYPKAIPQRCRSMWRSDRDYNFLFMGLITEERKVILDDWEDKLKKAKINQRPIIKDSRRGREFPGKAWDEEYYLYMSNARTVLCPNGDFVWTYRFFEAAMCGAIPIVEDTCELYEGFIFFKMSDDPRKIKWSEEAARHNHRKVIELLTLPKQLLVELITKNVNKES